LSIATWVHPGEPVEQEQQVRRHRREGADFFAPRLQQTRHQYLGVHVSHSNMHTALLLPSPFGPSGRASMSKESAIRARSNSWWCLASSRVRLTHGLAAPRRLDLCSAVTTNSVPLGFSFFIRGGDAPRHAG